MSHGRVVGITCLDSTFTLVSLSVEQVDDFFHRPDVRGDAGFHCWRHAQRLMHTAEVVPHEIERHGGRVILGRAVCRLVEGDEGLALTVEYGGDIILAEMVGDLDAAV